MSKIARIAVLVAALMSLFAVMSSAAGAVTWENSGDTSFTATGGPGTLSVGSVSLSCSSSDATGVTGTSPFVGTTWSAASGTATFTGCTLAGIPTAVGCGYTLTASAYTSPIVAGSVDVTCDATIGGTALCHISGATNGSYTNPGATNGKLGLVASNTLVVSNAAGHTCPLGTGNGGLSAQTFTITAATGGPTPHQGPVINRTP